MIEYSGNLLDRQFNIISKKSHHKNKEGGYTVTKTCEDIFTFDIETTSAWLDGDKIIPYVEGKDAEWWSKREPLALCYIWQFSFNDEVYYGRELREFTKVLDDLPKDAKIIIWVHNLSWEFQFLGNILTWGSVFARNTHKPMKSLAVQYPNIEWRCSYMLTRLSLATWGKQIGLPKMVGDLDYEVIRTPLTPLTDKEKGYAERDCLVVYEGIKKYRNEYKSLFKIPLTQTGTIRRVVKQRLNRDKSYSKFVRRLVPSAHMYGILKQVFAGGYTHANRLHSGQTIDADYINEDNIYIQHLDFASSYPTVMCCMKYPMSPWTYYRLKIEEDMFDDYAFIYRLKFSQLNSTNWNTYIQASKCINSVNTVRDNGRIISADSLEIYATEIDYMIMKENYEWQDIEVLECYKSRKDYLPRELILYIYELYGNKTSLKPKEGEVQTQEEYDLYMQSKQYINSCFGMMVTALVNEDIVYDEATGEWSIGRLNEYRVTQELEKLKVGSKTFLSYSWGVYVTALARYNLWKCIGMCGELGKDVIYCDTDSIFSIGKRDWSEYNDWITDKLRQSCKDLGIDFELTRPKTKSGKAKPLGIFTEETPCIEFRTLGAKRYCERRMFIEGDDEADGKLHLTVSGINKQAVDVLEDDINNFCDGLNFDKDHPSVNKKLSTYIENQKTIVFDDGYISTYKKGINLRRNGYLLTMTDDYKALIDYEIDWDRYETYRRGFMVMNL